MSKNFEHSKIVILPELIINQIAAGEVVERPASVVKELVENSIDAGSTKIDIDTIGGGKVLIRVVDNGQGIRPEEMELAVTRHATSKISLDNPFKILKFGFRGEALASIASISRFCLRSGHIDSSAAWELKINGDKNSDHLTPVAYFQGTSVSIEDIFFAVPPRLKFLKSDKAELKAIIHVIESISLAHPRIAFSVKDNGNIVTRLPSENEDPNYPSVNYPSILEERCAKIIGTDFVNNSIHINKEGDLLRSGVVTISGIISIPTLNRKTSSNQYIFINGRVVKLPIVANSIKYAYGDLLPPNRYPVFVLFINIPEESIDVNVHPAKTEVRFRHTEEIKKFLQSAVKSTILSAKAKTSSEISAKAISMLHKGSETDQLKQTHSDTLNTASLDPKNNQHDFHSDKCFREPASPKNWGKDGVTSDNEKSEKTLSMTSKVKSKKDLAIRIPSDEQEISENVTKDIAENYPIRQSLEDLYMSDPGHDDNKRKSLTADSPVKEKNLFGNDDENNLGTAKAQIHGNYIVSQSKDHLVIIDQHAAHERIIFEKLKEQMKKESSSTQLFLVRQVIELGKREFEALMEHKEDLARCGIPIDPFGANAICIRGIPRLLQDIDVNDLILDIAHDLISSDDGNVDTKDTYQNRILAKIACYGSIRSGRKLTIPEMDEIIRTIETNMKFAQCNHGRPTFIKLHIKDIEKLFERR